MRVKSVPGDSPALKWIKSSHSSNEHGSDCVEVASASAAVRVRDSKNVQGPELVVALGAWTDFVRHAAGHA